MRTIITLTAILLIASLGMAYPHQERVSATDNTAIPENFGKLPLYFIENQGQVHDDVAYYIKGADKTLYFTNQGVTFTLTGKGDGKEKRWSTKLDFVNANRKVKPIGAVRQDAVFSYFKGKPEDWKVGLPTYTKLIYEDIWPGIDLVYSGTVNELKYEFVVNPGADPKQIQLAYRGVSDLSVAESGALQINTPISSFEDGTPYAYQVLDGEKIEVTMAYAPSQKNDEDLWLYGFQVGTYDSNQPLILDPVVHVFCGYIGGGEREYGRDIVLDAQGDIYVTGCTYSDGSTFPVTAGPDLTFNGYADAFVAKIDAAGTALIYCGYIGGANYDAGQSIAVDQHGYAYITGTTYSDETSFPVVHGPDKTYNGTTDPDAFVARINISGTGLPYCGYIGGTGNDYGNGIAVDSDKCAYITGTTGSSGTSFPVQVGPDFTFNGILDGFIAKVEVGGYGLEYCGYIGGNSSDGANDIAVDASGNAFIAGHSESDETTFPVVVGPSLTYEGLGDAFVAQVNASGASLVYCGYIGGEAYDNAEDIALDSAGRAYIAGRTESEANSFPVKVGPYLQYKGSGDAFVAKVKKSGAGLIYCGYLGGVFDDRAKGIAVDAQGSAYLTGSTSSPEITFPVMDGPDLTFNGDRDAFIAKVNPQGSDYDFCGYIGGDGYDIGESLTVSTSGEIYVTGTTDSTQYTFPITQGPDITYNGGLSDAFVTMIHATQDLFVDDDNVSGPWTGSADHPFQQIQDGIDAAFEGDAVLVLPGTYVENIDFLGKTVTVQSTQGREDTVIDGNQVGTVVTFSSASQSGATLEGFTVQNGDGYEGGGIHCAGEKASIKNNTIKGNTASLGAGIYCDDGEPIITGNTFFGNNSTSLGAGICCVDIFGTETEISNNIILGNNATLRGGGILVQNSRIPLFNNIIAGNWSNDGGGLAVQNYAELTITNNTFFGNWASDKGGGIYNKGPYCFGWITNTICWNNLAPSGAEIYEESPGLYLSYCDVQGGWPGTGNINAAPTFVDPANYDVHLMYSSPCRDSGDNSVVAASEDIEGDPRIAYGTVDMGADEFDKHFYCTGLFSPGGAIEGKFVGLPGSTPVGLFIGSGIFNSPLQHSWGEFYLKPPRIFIPLIPIPSNGVLVIPTMLPATPIAPYDMPMQAVIGEAFSNLFVMEVR